MSTWSPGGLAVAAFVAACAAGVEPVPQRAPGPEVERTLPKPAVTGAPVVAADAVPEPPATRPSAAFVAVGDIMLSRRVAAAIARAGDPGLPFRGIAPLVAGVDFAVGNLEAPFAGHDTVSLGPANIFNVPRGHVAGLVGSKFRVVSLANNHALDQGTAGLSFTREHLRAHGIAFTGAGSGPAEAWAPAFVEAGGVRVAFVAASYASLNEGGRVDNGFVARLEHGERLREALGRARAEAHFVVVLMHAGLELMHLPERSQIDFARRSIDLEADLVIGAHPHVLQPVERYRDRYIFHSLGNFVFDHRHDPSRDSAAVRVDIALGDGPRALLQRLEVVPLRIDVEDFTPWPAEGEDRERILRQLRVDAAVLVEESSDNRE